MVQIGRLLLLICLSLGQSSLATESPKLPHCSPFRSCSQDTPRLGKINSAKYRASSRPLAIWLCSGEIHYSPGDSFTALSPDCLCIPAGSVPTLEIIIANWQQKRECWDRTINIITAQHLDSQPYMLYRTNVKFKTLLSIMLT